MDAKQPTDEQKELIQRLVLLQAAVIETSQRMSVPMTPDAAAVIAVGAFFATTGKITKEEETKDVVYL
jgi:hypothetical protein